MRILLRAKRPGSGFTLIEAVISIGVLAVAIPLALGAMAEAGKSGAAAEAETRSTWVIATCMEEVRAIRNGHSPHFDRVPAGLPFPGAGDLLALGFTSEGRLIGEISKLRYDHGVRESADPRVRYIATLQATRPAAADSSRLLNLRITLEYPASAPANKRRKIDFHSRIP